MTTLENFYFGNINPSEYKQSGNSKKKFSLQVCICLEKPEEKATAEARIQKIDSIIRCLYEDRVVGRISPERYDEMAAGYEKELADLKQKQAIKDFIEKSKVYIEMPKLTAKLLHTFIQRVDVYEKPTKYSRTEGNPVMIYYKYRMTTDEQWQILTGEGYSEADDVKAEFDTNTSISA